LNEGALVACEVVWTETRSAFADDAAMRQAMDALGVAFSPISLASAEVAGAVWKRYRTGGGKRDRVVADFLIGAHAATQCDRLLTRDRGYYKKHFAGLAVFDPSS
jgi:hypothetical protein